MEEEELKAGRNRPSHNPFLPQKSSEFLPRELQLKQKAHSQRNLATIPQYSASQNMDYLPMLTCQLFITYFLHKQGNNLLSGTVLVKAITSQALGITESFQIVLWGPLTYSKLPGLARNTRKVAYVHKFKITKILVLKEQERKVTVYIHLYISSEKIFSL